MLVRSQDEYGSFLLEELKTSKDTLKRPKFTAELTKISPEVCNVFFFQLCSLVPVLE